MPSKTSKVTKRSDKKVEQVPVVSPASPVLPKPAPVKSEADKMWEEIKHLPIQMFGLPDQFVIQHCTPIPVDPNTLYVTIRSTATLPSLEAAIAPAFTVELADKFVMIKRAPKPLIPSKQR